MSVSVIPSYGGYGSGYGYGVGACGGGGKGNFRRRQDRGSVHKDCIGYMMVSWTRPKRGYFKLNTDGASKGNPGPSSCGGIIRDSDGKWVFGFHVKVGITSSIEAELWGLRYGLMCAVSEGLKKGELEVEVDATQVLMLLDGKDHPKNGTQCMLVSQCRVLLARFGLTTPKHVYREANQCADMLASLHLFNKCTTTQEELFIKAGPCFSFWGSRSAPSCIEDRVAEDASGKLYKRKLYEQTWMPRNSSV